ncbi:tetratricopeptide repeat protein [Mucilaginibacter ginsenosidivorax]|uniref:NB-ARC domain-containing protein n=1 Tax=Mucilaginibacter ginsenosidivorax TaxID=862126 RepID=A0A5B8VXP9_9SPHI|nr:tetratricopeptide repeat protein [Mucilaginibacter ginsenosidivorax]QEC76350.1 hypothetical protein FSB76_10480 [Mucilaginibacter ginsenosidivorax]
MHIHYKIFLASSSELAGDRQAFGDMVQELNGKVQREGKQVYFDLYKWGHGTMSFAQMRKQATYIQEIETCHIFVMLYESKVGEYTDEEYEFAYKRFKETGEPQVLVFKKQTAKTTDSSLKAFEAKIAQRDGQFKPRYTDADDLRVKLFSEIDKYFATGILQPGLPAETICNDGQSVPGNFVGREEELKAIRQKLDAGGKLMLINAEGGIGKTTLAARYWQESTYHYKFNAWLFCENGIVSELKKLAPRFNIDLSNLTEEEQLERLKAGLQNVSHNFLLVLDNANTPEHIEAFKQNFRGFHWHVLMTSRCHGILEPGQEYQITHLPPPLARALFMSNYTEEGPEFETLLDKLLLAINYHTLLIDIFSKNMLELKKRGETLAELLCELENYGLFLGKRSFEVNNVYAGNLHKKAATTDQILDILYDFSKLDHAERYWLVNMALLPAVPHHFMFLCELFKQDKFEFKVLDVLAKKGWLIDDDVNYRISPVVQKVTLAKNKETVQKDSEALLDNLNEQLENDGTYLEHFNSAGPFVSLAETITKNLINKPSQGLITLNFNAVVYYISTGNLSEALSVAQIGQKISLQLNNKGWLAVFYSKVGEVHEATGRLADALQFYHDYLKLSEELHAEFPSDVSFKDSLAISYLKVGDIHQANGRLADALQFYNDSLKLSEELYHELPSVVSFKNGLAISYSRLGEIHQANGRQADALQFYNDYLKLSEELYHEFPSNVSFKKNLAISYSKVGDIHQANGRLADALQFYKDYLKLSEELYHEFPSDASFKRGLAISYSKVGEIHQANGRLAGALQFYNDYLKLSEELYHEFPSDVSFKRGLAISYLKVGEIHQANDRLADALQFYNDSLELLKELYHEFPSVVSFKNGLAISYSRVGAIHQANGRLADALQFYRDYLKLLEELHHDFPSDVSFKDGLAISYTQIGAILLKGDILNAQQYFRNAKKVWDELVIEAPQYEKFSNNLRWVDDELKKIENQ